MMLPNGRSLPHAMLMLVPEAWNPDATRAMQICLT